jgi:hypothetical protein
MDDAGEVVDAIEPWVVNEEKQVNLLFSNGLGREEEFKVGVEILFIELKFFFIETFSDFLLPLLEKRVILQHAFSQCMNELSSNLLD